jgi:hypothetical protein
MPMGHVPWSQYRTNGLERPWNQQQQHFAPITCVQTISAKKWSRTNGVSEIDMPLDCQPAQRGEEVPGRQLTWPSIEAAQVATSPRCIQ